MRKGEDCCQRERPDGIFLASFGELMCVNWEYNKKGNREV